MVKIQRKKIVKVGNSHYFNVPIELIHSELIEENKTYDLLVSKSK